MVIRILNGDQKHSGHHQRPGRQMPQHSLFLEQPYPVEDAEEQTGSFGRDHVGHLDFGHRVEMAEDHPGHEDADKQDRPLVVADRSPGGVAPADEDQSGGQADQQKIERPQEEGRCVAEQGFAHYGIDAVERGGDQHQPRPLFSDNGLERDQESIGAGAGFPLIQQPGAADHQQDTGKTLGADGFAKTQIAGEDIEDRGEGEIWQGMRQRGCADRLHVQPHGQNLDGHGNGKQAPERRRQLRPGLHEKQRQQHQTDGTETDQGQFPGTAAGKIAFGYGIGGGDEEGGTKREEKPVATELIKYRYIHLLTGSVGRVFHKPDDKMFLLMSGLILSPNPKVCQMI